MAVASGGIGGQMWTVAGLVADIAGFSILAFEWHRTFRYTEEIRQLQLQDANERNEAREQGRKPEFRIQMEEEAMAKEFSKLRGGEATFRERLFWLGIGLVVLGFACQLVGALAFS